MEVITLPDGEKFPTVFSESDIEFVCRKFCGEEFTRGLMEQIEELENRADYEELKFNSDFTAYEGENETFRDTLQDIEMLLKQFERNTFDRNKKLIRIEVIRLFNDIHKLIGEVI